MGRIVWVGFAAWLVAACGPSESKFVVEYTDAFCVWYLDCGDPALLVFDGLDTLEECQALYGPDVAERATSCKMDHGAGRRCLAAMEGLTCPAEEGTPLEDSLPAECATTWKKCAGEGAEGDDTGEEV